MRRLLPPLVLPVLAVVVAAPVPKLTEKQRLVRLFGAVADAPKGYEFALDGDKLVVTMAANASDTIEEAPPRTEHEVTGDFEARVVLTFAPPKKKLADAGTSPHLIAGLGAWGKGGRFVMRAPYYGSAGATKNADGWGYGEMGYVRTADDKAECGWSLARDYQKYEKRYLRLQREKGECWYSESADGKEWEPEARDACPLPDTVRLGVFVVNTTNAECTVTFSDFTVTPLKPTK